MENISYVGLSQQIALQREMEMTANNIANMNTTGYKTQKVMFLEYLNRARDSGIAATPDTLRQVLDYGSYRDLSAGTLHQTHNTLDFALQGEGYFAVETGAGTQYTRNGSFSLNNNGDLVTQAGYAVLDENGGAITIPPETRHITLTRQGDVVADDAIIGRLKIAVFDNPQALRTVGDNLLDAGGAVEMPAEERIVLQGMVEKSNVNPVTEMNRMIEVLRMYQATAKMIQNDHERIRTAIQKLSKV